MPLRRLLIAALLLVCALPATACRMTMALDQWPPYLYRDAQGRDAGLDLELVRAIFSEAHCTLVALPELPAARRQLLFRKGGLDMMPAASPTGEREAYARFTSSYRNETVGIFGKPGSASARPPIASIAQLVRGKATLLAPRVGWYGGEYAAALPALENSGRLSQFGSFEQGLRMFEAGRADLLMGDVLAMRHAARQQGVALSAVPFVVRRAPVSLMLNARTTSSADLARLNGAIAQLERRGALAAIRARYEHPHD